MEGRAGKDDRTLARLATLAVEVGANVQPGQVVALGTELGKEELTRAVAHAAYRRGAKYVDAFYWDAHLKRARLEHAAEETLDYVPSWYADRVLALGEQRCARVSFTGPVEPGLFDDIDARRTGRDQLPWVKEVGAVVNDRTTNWTAVPCPTPGWAALVHPDLEPDDALAKLWEEIAHVCRLDAEDPAAAWRERMDVVTGAGERLTERRFATLHFEGPGTDLRVGLLPTSQWSSARFSTAAGIDHMPNIPSEETFTTPDPARTEGHVTSTKPLYLGGTIVEGLRVRFAGGRAVQIDADAGAEVVRAWCERDEGAARLGEVALVDREGRIGPLGTTFFDTLLDENAASHVAFGGAYAFTVDEPDRGRINRSAIHVDFMIGGDDVDVTGEAGDGARVPVLRGGAWQV